jgi:hypothetical protein
MNIKANQVCAMIKNAFLNAYSIESQLSILYKGMLENSRE